MTEAFEDWLRILELGQRRRMLWERYCAMDFSFYLDLSDSDSEQQGYIDHDVREALENFLHATEQLPDSAYTERLADTERLFHTLVVLIDAANHQVDYWQIRDGYIDYDPKFEKDHGDLFQAMAVW
jgi:hypothetical protein